MPESSDDKTWMTTVEAQEYLRVSKTTLYDCMKDGRLPFYYIKGTRQRRVKKADLDSLMTIGDSIEEPYDEGA